MIVSRPALRYYGSKWRLAPTIISLFPVHTCYVEPFGGSATVLLQKIESVMEVYNDSDQQVVNFFRVLREQTEAFISAIQLTPYSRCELETAYQPTDNEFESARRFYIRSWQSRHGPSGSYRSGWRFQRKNARGKTVIDEWNSTNHLWQVVDRLKNVQIECADAFEILNRYDAPETLFYLDPPYLASTRARRKKNGYQCEMSEQDHQRLLSHARELQGMVILSSYPNDLYAATLYDWEDIEISVRTEGNGKATDVLWLSPNVADSRLPLFEYVIR